MLRRALLGASLAVTFALAPLPAGCGNDTPDFTVIPFDAGEAGVEGGRSEAGPDFDPTLGGPCSDDAQCDDAVACTFDRCDLTISRCRNVPDDSLCDDGVYCNGKERCVLRQGCAPGPVVTCSDQNVCTIDRCVEADQSCAHDPRDSDGDGDPDDHCQPEADCDDTDPTVSSKRAEICGNLKDDNCNGEVDEVPCAVPEYDTCASAREVTAPSTLVLSTVATAKDYATTCSVPTPAAGHDLVVAITVPAGEGPKDVLVRADTSAPVNQVAVALEATCGDSASEIHCGYASSSRDARAIARSVAAGTTIYGVITTQSESAVDVKIEFLPPTTKPANEDCAAPEVVAVDTPFVARIVDATTDLETACSDRARTGELTYAFDLASPRDVRIFTSTLSGSGSPVVSLRAPTCSDELRCRGSTNPPLFARSLPAGRHVFSVAGTSQIDANVVVRTYDPTPPPPTQSCATAEAVPQNGDFIVDLSQSEDSFPNGCFPGAPAAAYRLDVGGPLDVLAIARFPSGDTGALSLNGEGCTTADRIACVTGSSPVRLLRRNLVAGSYRLIVSGSSGQSAEVAVFTRQAAPPTVVTSDGCLGTQAIPALGGFFTGDTSSATADFNAGCDTGGLPFGGARDQLLRLDLAERRRVLLDMSGSRYQTLLDVRSGTSCPGLELPNACNPGNQTSFLDLVLDQGSYWLQIDGFALAAGEWNLSAFIVPP